MITPRAIEYDYKLMFEDRIIKLMTYNTETLLAEKMQTILARGIANTRLRDFHDVLKIWQLCYHLQKYIMDWVTLIRE